VRDEGVGIPPTARASVWDQFGRVEGAEVQSGSGIGLGLGLHISKAIVEGHHGQVEVESAPGRGSTFWFSLPLAPLLENG
jgi:signal transduction histidine kinase